MAAQKIKRPLDWDVSWAPLAKYGWETQRAWWGLVEYALMGEDRSLPDLCLRFRDSPSPAPTRDGTVLNAWARKYFWPERVAAFDRELKQRDIEEYVTEDAEAKRQRRRIAKQMLDVSETLNFRLAEVVARRLAPREVAGYTKVALDESRQEHSGHTEVVKHEVEVGVDQDLATLLRQSIEVRTKPPQPPSEEAPPEE